MKTIRLGAKTLHSKVNRMARIRSSQQQIWPIVAVERSPFWHQGNSRAAILAPSDCKTHGPVISSGISITNTPVFVPVFSRLVRCIQLSQTIFLDEHHRLICRIGQR
jgi:hypothetical protein